MKRILFSALMPVVASVYGAATLSAQRAHIGIGGGAIIPLGAYAANDNLGWHVLGHGELNLPLSRVSIRVDALYGQTLIRALSAATRGSPVQAAVSSGTLRFPAHSHDWTCSAASVITT
jgi:hypothetical protein